MLYLHPDTETLRIPRHYFGGSAFVSCNLILKQPDGIMYTISNIAMNSSEFYWNLNFTSATVPTIPDGQYTYSLQAPSNYELEKGICQYGTIQTTPVTQQNNPITVYEKE